MGNETPQEEISLLLDADLDVDERKALEALLEEDPDLRQHFQEFKEVWTLLDQYSPIKASSTLSYDLMARVRSEKALEVKGYLVRLAAGWAAAAALFLAVFLGLPDKQRPEDSTEVFAGHEMSEDYYSMYVASLYDFEDF